MILFSLFSAVSGHFRDIFAKPPCTNLKEWRSNYCLAIHLHFEQNDFGSSGYAMKNCDDCLISVTGDGVGIEKVVYEIMELSSHFGKRMIEEKTTYIKWYPYKGKLGIFNMSEVDKKQLKSSIANGLKDRVDARRDPSPSKRTLGKTLGKKLLSKNIVRADNEPKTKPKPKTKLNIKHRK